MLLKVEIIKKTFTTLHNNISISDFIVKSFIRIPVYNRHVSYPYGIHRHIIIILVTNKMLLKVEIIKKTFTTLHNNISISDFIVNSFQTFIILLSVFYRFNLCNVIYMLSFSWIANGETKEFEVTENS